MTETTMPAAEAQEGAEMNSYELAFHVLPTVAEGEVTSVCEAIKASLQSAGAQLGVEEAPARIELAYDIEKYLEGKYRKFTSAYFGWVRFKAEPSVIAELTEELESNQNILRHLIVKLTKVEEAHPFYYHAALADETQVANVDVEAALESVDDAEATATTDDAATTETEDTTTDTDDAAADTTAAEETKA
jgi:ribosomal protein S6